MKIGFIGLGIMGSRMAANLLKNKLDVVITNRTKEKAKELIGNGAKWLDSPKEVGANSDIVITMLSTPEVVEAVSFAEDGFVEEMKEGSVWIDCTTVNPTFSEYIDDRLAFEDKVTFVDAPVAGSLKPAQDGTLTFLVGASKENFERVKPLLECMGKKIVHCGEVGSGSDMKMIVNSLLGISMAGFSEVLAFGESLGFERRFLLEALSGSPVVAPFIEMKKEKLLKDDFSEEFPLRWMHKDLNLATWTAYESEAAMPILNAVKEVYSQAKNEGLSNMDMSAVFKTYQRKEK